MWLLMGKVEEQTQISWGQFAGKVRRPGPTGDAFVDCAEIKDKFGREAYAFCKVLRVCEVKAGDDIRFDLHVNDKNMPQVSAPIWKLHQESPEAKPQQKVQTQQSAEFGEDSIDAELRRIQALESGGGSAVSATGFAAEGMSIAVLKKTFPQKGFSLLTTDPDDETSSVYIHHSVCRPELLEAAAAVAFKPHTNAKGDIQASAPVWLLFGRVDPSKEIKWGTYTGTVDRLSSTGDAFVTCPAVRDQYEREAYIFRKVKKMCEIGEGDEICFDVHVNERGMPQVPAPIWKCHYDWGYKGKGAKGPVKGQALKGPMKGQAMGGAPMGGLGKGLMAKGMGKGGAFIEEMFAQFVMEKAKGVWAKGAMKGAMKGMGKGWGHGDSWW